MTLRHNGRLCNSRPFFLTDGDSLLAACWRDERMT